MTRFARTSRGAARRVALAAMSVGVAVAVAATTAGGPGVAGSSAAAAGSAPQATGRRSATPPGGYGSGRGPSAPGARAAGEAGVDASAQFRLTVGVAASSFVDDVDDLQQAVAAGDVTAARTDELAAQAQYDALRYLTPSGSATSSTLDETTADVPNGSHLAGLHLVERDLWDGGDAAAAVPPLAAAAPLLEDALSRIQLSPHAIDLVAVDELGWVTSVAVPGLEETYSHLDSVDVAATVGAARAAFEAVAPLGRLVTAGRTATAGSRFGTLAGAVQALGTPGTVPDGAIPETRWRSVAEDADATAAVLASLAPALAGYGPRQIYGYNS